jgi:hypothetical protein
MLDRHPTYVPIHEGVIFKCVMDIALVDITPYWQLVGKFLYFLRMHFDIAYVANVDSWYMQALEVTHLQIVLFIFLYFHCYPSCGIYYIEGEENTLWVTLILILLKMQMIDVPKAPTSSCLDPLPFHGRPKSKLRLLDLVVKLSIEPCLIVLVKDYGFMGYLMILALDLLAQPFSSVIIRAQ